MTLTKDMGIMEVVSNYPETVEVFINAGMGCLGCAAAHFENIEQGATAHGIDVDQLMEDLTLLSAKKLNLHNYATDFFVSGFFIFYMISYCLQYYNKNTIKE